MAERAPDGTRPVLKQYFGANKRHPEACIEMSFPLPERRFSLLGLAERLRRKGFDVDIEAFARERPLPEAIGVLVSTILAKAVEPRWSCGTEGRTGWICMTYLSPLSAANAMLQSHAVLVGGGAPAAVDELLRTVWIWVSPGTINGMLVSCASAMGLEALSVSNGGHVFQIGAGARARHFCELTNEGDSATGHMLVNNKLSTVETLQRVGLPTTDAVALWRPEDAPRIAARIGYPCVVKPRNRGKGYGVTAHIQSERHLAEAVDHAASLSTFPLVIENHVEGADHRMMVVDGKLLWVYRRTPPSVIGDGTSTVKQLIAAENGRRTAADLADRAYLQPIVADGLMARFVEERYGLTMRSVLAAGTRLELSAQANVSRGGTLEDVTPIVHPDNRKLAVTTARLLRINALGLDFISPDISRSWKEVPSAIIEANGSPGISGRGDASLALRTLFPATLSGRVPTFVVVGDERYQRETGRMIVDALSRRKLIVGRCVHGAARVRKPGTEQFWSIRVRNVEALLLNPDVQAVVITSTPEQIERLGFPVESCDALLAGAKDLPAFATRPAKAVVDGILDDESGASLVEGIAAAYRGDRPGGAWPVVELRGGTRDEGTAATIRCWRIRALPRALFRADLEGPRVGMVTQEDIAGMIARQARRHLLAAEGEGATIDLGETPPGAPWDTPYVDIPVLIAGSPRQAALDALASATSDMNRLIERLV